MSESPLEMRRPPKKYGAALGMRSAHQRLQAAGAVHAEQVEEAGIDAAQADGGVGNDGKDRDHRCAHGEREMRILDENDDQRRDRDDRGDLEQHRVREEALLDDAALHEQERDQCPEHDRGRKRLQRHAQGSTQARP